MSHVQSIERTALMVIDVQENHFPHCLEREAALDVMVRVARAARILGVPTIVTEHNPKAFGPTVGPLADATTGIVPLPKISFSCLADEAILARVQELGARNLVLVGTETHICIAQTALMAVERGLTAAVVADGVTSRKARDHAEALARLRSHGVEVLTWESLVYEWMGRGGTDLFRQILPIVKGAGS
jgi:nicotinamidase-related amidase